ncbi:hypothetical protein J4463_03675 [Candidatus Pacearchaeota archaeon]|nr:hypothetical protein [Candidatus Pacearchaeota archaeon]
MRDKKFAVAVVIIVVLALALLFVLVVSPAVNQYILNKQIGVANEIVNGIIQTVNQQGYITLSNGNETMVLVKYIAPPATQ